MLWKNLMANRPNKNNLFESLYLLQNQTPNDYSVLKFSFEICVMYLVSDKARMATTPFPSLVTMNMTDKESGQNIQFLR